MGRAAAAVVLTVLWGTWTMAAAQEQSAAKRIEITAPGEYTQSDCTFVMTKDVVSKGAGLSFTGKNIVVDLGGHTLTFDTETPYKPVFKENASRGFRYMFRGPYGVCFQAGSANVELKNGTIVQGAGHDTVTHGLFIRADGAKVHDLTVVITGGHQANNVYAQWGGTHVELYNNYFVNHGDADKGWYGAVQLTEAGTDWDIHHNTVVGGHQGILVGGRREKEGVHVHHNYIQHRRTRGQKVPEGIYIRANGVEIDHNEIVTDDGRGLEPTGGNNYWHDNIVDVRYTSKAGGGFYPENRCYGYWARDKGTDGNVIEHNLFVVNNEVMGDDTSSCIGALITTSPNAPQPVKSQRIVGNRFIVMHNDPSRPAWGICLTHAGDQVVIKDNWIWAKTAGMLIRENCRGVTVEGNTFVKSSDNWKLSVPYEGKPGVGIQNTTFKDNKVVAPPADKQAPAAPTGLKITRRINGYELHWAPNAEPDVLGYYVWRDGKKVEDRLKCGHFYVDTAAEPDKQYTYTLSAVDLSHNESPQGAGVSTK